MIGNPEAAAGMYANAVIHSHQFLFDSELNVRRNAYDPQFRSICDVYNQSLAAILRTASKEASLRGGNRFVVGRSPQSCEIEFQLAGRWKDQQFERFELVNDYTTSGIDNQYRTYGLGVPLIAVCQKDLINSPEGRYYPPSLTRR